MNYCLQTTIVHAEIAAMTWLRRSLIAVALAIGSSCGPSAWAGSGVEVENSEFDSGITIRGPMDELKREGSSKGRPDDFFFNLLTVIDKKTRVRTDMLSVLHIYSAKHWHFFHSVSDDTAKDLEFVKGVQRVEQCHHDCLYVEKFAAALPTGYLETRTGGFRLRFRSRQGGDAVIAVSSDQIRMQLDAVRKLGR